MKKKDSETYESMEEEYIKTVDRLNRTYQE